MNGIGKKIILAALFVLCATQALPQEAYPAELALVAQPTMSCREDALRLYYDVQNIGLKRYKGNVYIYLDPDNGYYYAKKKVRVRKGKVKRIKIDLPTNMVVRDTVYTVMPYYSVGSYLNSFTIYEDFGLLYFCINKPEVANYIVTTPAPKPTAIVYSNSNTRYYYDGYSRPTQMNNYYSTPYHHTYQYHRMPNHGYYGPNASPQPNTNHNNHGNNITESNNTNNNTNTQLNGNNQAHVHHGTAGSMSSNNATPQNNNDSGNNNHPENHDNNANVNNHDNHDNHNNNDNHDNHGATNHHGTTGNTNTTTNTNSSGSNTNNGSGRTGTTSRTGNISTNNANNNASSSSANSGRTGSTSRTSTTNTSDDATPTSSQTRTSTTNTRSTTNTNSQNGSTTRGK